MLNFLPQLLIFASLAVIVFIIGRKIPQLRELNKTTVFPKNENRSGKISGFLKMVLEIIKNVFVFLAEWVVKKAKKILHLVHFWLIKIKRDKTGDDEEREIEAKQELIKEEEKNLETVLNEDLGRQQPPGEIKRNNIAMPKQLNENDKNNRASLANEGGKHLIDDQRDEKIEEFFTETEKADFIGEEEVEVKKAGFFSRLFGRNKAKSADKYEYQADTDEGQRDEKNYLISDGVSVSQIGQNKESRLIKEVYDRKKGDEKQDRDYDDDLGVDRGILEKKIIQKIAANPKDLENFRQLGELYIKMKNFNDAEESYKQVLKISPRDVDAKRKLEKIKLLKRLR